jgi:hypothetical protein
MFDSREVFADVTLSASTGVWAGSGPKVEYASYPTDDEVSGAQTYDKFYHYRQGVVFQFRSSGIFYIIEWMCTRHSDATAGCDCTRGATLATVPCSRHRPCQPRPHSSSFATIHAFSCARVVAPQLVPCVCALFVCPLSPLSRRRVEHAHPGSGLDGRREDHHQLHRHVPSSEGVHDSQRVHQRVQLQRPLRRDRHEGCARGSAV